VRSHLYNKCETMLTLAIIRYIVWQLTIA